MSPQSRRISLCSVTLILAAFCNCSNSARSGSICTQLLFKLKNGDKADVMLELPSLFSKVMRNPALKFLIGAAKAGMMKALMKQATAASQAPFMAVIRGLGISKSATPFWISNHIGLNNVDLKAVRILGALPGVFHIREQFVATIDPVEVGSDPIHKREIRQIKAQWGVSKIGAPSVWGKTKGENIVVATIDSGVYAGHEALKDNYAGKWLDASGESNSTTPIDTNKYGHGTHVMGIICGRTKGIGVAPGAKWIACKAFLANGSSKEIAFRICGQWIFQQRPHIVSNSWVGGSGNSEFGDIIQSWREVGIIPIFAIGNHGDLCRSAGSPGDQPNVISVGSTSINDTMSKTSGRGFAKSGAIKPEVTAPGVDIYSAWFDSNRKTNLYSVMSGTSMACPNAGAVALMLSANPSWKFDDVLSALKNTADRPPVDAKDLACGNTTTSNYPNNAFGWGRINVKKALGM